jgi:hypothetical protein
MTIEEAREELKRLFPGRTVKAEIQLWHMTGSGDCAICHASVQPGFGEKISSALGDSLADCLAKLRDYSTDSERLAQARERTLAEIGKLQATLTH